MADHRSEDGMVARLEVRRGTDDEGKEEWSDAGHINVDAAEVLEAVRTSQSDATPSTSVASSRLTGNAAPTTAGRKRMLPRRTKLLLSPNARIKADRRANFLFRHSSDGIDSNLLVLLHGAGDSHKPFHELSRQMQLPQTASLSIHASSCGNGFITLPFNLGSTWFEEMDYSITGDVLPDNHPRRVSSLSTSVDSLIEILQSLCPADDEDPNEGWQPERIFLFGYSSGACLAMETCLRLAIMAERPLGGGICVAGGAKCVLPLNEKCDRTSTDSDLLHDGCTAILLLVGSDDRVFPPSAARHASKLYNDAYKSSISPHRLQSPADPVSIYIKKGKGHAMVSSEEEMKSIMEFFSQRLVREMPSTEAAVARNKSLSSK